MNELTIPQEGAGHHRLFGGWRDVLDDVRLLCRALGELPDGCRCGQGAAHLQGTCPCCGTTATTRVPACADCEELLARLRTPIDLLMVDTLRFFPVVKELLARQSADAFERVRAIEREIGLLVRSFAQLVVAADRFRDDCRASHLTTLKETAAVLRRHAEALDRIV